MRILQDIRFYFVIVCLTSLWLMVIHFNLLETIKNDKVIIVQKDSIIDDLKFQIQVKEIDLERYEIILDKISEKNSKIVEDATHETE